MQIRQEDCLKIRYAIIKQILIQIREVLLAVVIAWNNPPPPPLPEKMRPFVLFFFFREFFV